MEIIRKDNGNEGVFKTIKNGEEIGEMTYIWRSGNKILINHTEVDPEYEGQGIGKKMVMQAVDFARKNDVKIIPVCPFVVALFERIPEIGDVLAD
ncbi:MAG: N-acetyltransferase [Candidatus Symbiothrix sp.]|jgi:predicted GNAT family acetyltransferase|nr:N-acetyltransferase [Candidatus Symbiothrix sp.]